MKLRLLLKGLAFATTILAACQQAKVTDPPKLARPIVVVIRAQPGGVARTITLPGDLVGYYESALYSKVTGYLKTIFVDKGDMVRTGQVLAIIESPACITSRWVQAAGIPASGRYLHRDARGAGGLVSGSTKPLPDLGASPCGN